MTRPSSDASVTAHRGKDFPAWRDDKPIEAVAWQVRSPMATVSYSSAEHPRPTIISLARVRWLEQGGAAS